MYIRRDPRKLKDGTERCYISLAHNVWEAGPMGNKRTKPVILARLGHEDELDVETVRSMRDAFDRYLHKRLAREGREPDGAEAAGVVERLARKTRGTEPTLRVLASREYGLRAIVEPIWEGMGLKKVMREVAAQHRVRFDFERVVFGMVLNRLADPKSKRACNEWLKDECWFPEAEEWGVQHFYRALDLLEAHSDEVADRVLDAVRQRLPADELTLLLLDTTSTYFESDLDDVERVEVDEDWRAHERGERPEPLSPVPQVVNKPPLRMRGFSKDHRPDKPQVVIGAVAGRKGRLLRHKVYRGNKQDQTVTLDMLEDLDELVPEGRPVIVADSGMSGGPNLAKLDAMDKPPDRITAVPVRRSKLAREILSRPGRWRHRKGKPHMKVRVVQLSVEESPSERAEAWIATRNRRDAERQQRKLDKQLAKVRAELAKRPRLDEHGRSTCKLLTHRTLKKFVQPSRDGKRLVLNQERIREERRLCGVRLLRTTLTDVDPDVVLDGYQELLNLEDGFRRFKGPLKLRPMHHRSTHRIRAHVMVCALALVCMQELEHRTGRRFQELQRAVAPVRASHIEQSGSRFWLPTDWPYETLEVLRQLGIEEGPRSWGAERVTGFTGSTGDAEGETR